jgi:hypothetical protein
MAAAFCMRHVGYLLKIKPNSNGKTNNFEWEYPMELNKSN